ncbi:MrcB family domain-containing protein [Listeria seeligeri]|uniref:MrcB family domain-containing protein n=1 Tax=Listeria seeligeri TaxID=1640 RepID=UPI0016269623|nr:DUF3578 domain-containing protein [Listeria seeligeri]MBC2071167.1 DUF3578 domain-containing protein [Listeria seeligeri]MBC2088245.1 DUF3578 domain-containing protein [Listeria seeligeri]MBF2653709.1 DUF3578 domain-containing protein [Listeria seeligeri]
MDFVALLKYMQENYGEQITNHPMAGNEVAKNFKQGAKTAVPIALLGEDYKVSASIGKGVWANVPWIAVHDKAISTSVKQGVNIVYLFTNDYNGVYLSLNQGYTFINDNYKDTKTTLKKIAYFWQDNLSTLKTDDNFTTEPINLGINAKRYNTRVKGYENCNIYSKFYDISQLTEDDNNLLLQDLLHMITVFKELKMHLIPDKEKSVKATIDFILTDGDYVELNEKAKSDKINNLEKERKLVLVKEEAKQKGILIKEGSVEYETKRDYVKEAIRNTEKGLQGEILVLNFERERLLKNPVTKPYVEKITHVAQNGDGHGYDIISYDVDPISSDKVIEIYIEVKTTIGSRNTPFYISENELNVAKLKGERYKIYRVYNYNGMPKLKIIDDLFTDKFIVEPINYIVRGVNQNDKHTKI